MKAILQKVPESTDSSFAIQEFSSQYFSIPWHFHPEYELVLIRKGEGKRFVGDNIAVFKPGDLVLLGPNIPHWYRSDSVYYNNLPGLESQSLVIQFVEDFLGNQFFQAPETAAIRQVLRKAQKGLELYGSLKEEVTETMLRIRKLTGMDKLMAFLSLLNNISRSQEYRVLSEEVSGANINTIDSARINKVYEYVMSNFQEQITIKEAADLIHMCSSAFCRYFKKRTRKTFTSFLNEIRIGHACKLLIEEEMSITEICYESGFNNISYFNRQFKTLKNTTPQLFRLEYHEKQALSFPL